MAEVTDPLELERQAVRAASEAAEIFASPPAQERSLGWHLRRRALRFVLTILILSAVSIGALVVYELCTPQRPRHPRPPATQPR